MSKVILTFVFIFLLNFEAISQQNTPPQSPTAGSSSSNNPSNVSSSASPTAPNSVPTSNNSSSNTKRNAAAEIEKQIKLNSTLDPQLVSMMSVDSNISNLQDIKKIYRKTSKKDLSLVALNSADSQKFNSFLKQENTGLVKLLPNSECDIDSKIFIATDKCLKYSLPGAGASYSFRTEDYRINRLSDLILDSSSFRLNGALTQGILVAVGNIPLEQLTLENPVLKYLVDFQPSIEPERVLSDRQKLLNGIKGNGFLYSSASTVIENMTYALRSIAYRGNLYREFKGTTYDEFSFDKRKDVIIGFQVVRKDSDGSVTILWKEMNRKDSPKLSPIKDNIQN